MSACGQGRSPLASQALDVLDGAYASDVTPADAKFTQCAYKLASERHIVRCGLSFGGAELAQIGYWEIVGNDASFSVYAMNGKALAALDRITRPGAISSTAYPGAFKSGAGRTPLDMAKVSAAFKQ